MEHAEPDEDREHRIHMEIVVDAYDADERAMGWFSYLEDQLSFPFRATCMVERPISPLQKGEVVEVTGLAPAEECEHEMFVEVRWQGRQFAVPLSQLQGNDVDEDTQEAIADWHYWVARGYEF